VGVCANRIGVEAWKELTSKYLSATEFVEANEARGFGEAATVVQALKQCGRDRATTS
jgi:hypothetical protein